MILALSALHAMVAICVCYYFSPHGSASMSFVVQGKRRWKGTSTMSHKGNPLNMSCLDNDRGSDSAKDEGQVVALEMNGG